MKLAYKVGIHTVVVLNLLLFIAVSKNEYSWMRDIDPSMTQLPIDNKEQIKLFITFAVLILTIAGQTIIIKKTSSSLEKAFSIGLIVLTMTAWWIAFYR